MSTEKTYVTLEPVDADKHYPIGKPIRLSWEHAEPLLAVRAIEEPTATDEPEPTGDADQAQADGEGLEFEAPEVQAVAKLGRQLDDMQAALVAEREAVGALTQAHELAQQELLQAREDIQALQTAKAAAASELAELKLLHEEAMAAKAQLAGEVAELQAKLAAATKPKKS